jgi:hypothetical protein
MVIAKNLAILGKAIELVWQIEGGELQAARWTRSSSTAYLCSNGDGTSIYLLTPSKTKRRDVPTGRGDLKTLIHKWGGTTEKAYEWTVSKTTLYLCGEAKTIIYESDKWTGKKAKYEHEYSSRHPVKVYNERGAAPHLFGLQTVDGRKLVSPRGLIG